MHIIDVLKDKELFKNLSKIAIPIALQNLIMSAINMADVFMIGQLGESEIAGVGLANQIFFIFTLILFGVNTASGIFIAQYNGKKNITNIHKTLRIALSLSLLVGICFSISSLWKAEILIKFYSKEAIVIKLGASYLRLIAINFPFYAISFVFAMSLRSISRATLPMYLSLLALVLNIGLDYLFIFGKFGMPKMGVEGAAIATTIAQITQFTVLVACIYISKKYHILAIKLKKILEFDFIFFRKFMYISAPVIVNEFIWSMGITTQNAIYGHMGATNVACVNISSSIERLIFVLILGLSSATGVMVGNKIGEGKKDEAYQYAIKLSYVSLICAILIMTFLLLGGKYIIGMFNVSDIVSRNSYYILVIIALVSPFKAFNSIHIVGSIRSGGDTRYVLFLDLTALWLISIPLAAIGAFYMDLPIYWVYFLAISEEVLKFGLIFRRLVSKKWIRSIDDL